MNLTDLVQSWKLRASILEDKGRQEGVYSKKERDLWKLRAKTIQECADELSKHVKAFDICQTDNMPSSGLEG